MSAHHRPHTVSSVRYSEQLWRWFRARHAAVQIIGWLAFWWLLLPVLIWRTGVDTKWKLAFTAPFALVALSALVNGPLARQATEPGLQRSVAIADTQTGGAVEANAPDSRSIAPTSRPTLTPRTSAPVLPTREPATTIPATTIPPTEVPPTAVPPTAVPPTATPLSPIAQIDTNGNVRSYPSTESGQVISKVAAGETITLVSKTPDGAWYEMTTAAGTKGYVSTTLLDLAPGVSDIIATRDAGPPPVVAKPPARPAAKPAAKPAAQCDPNYSGACIPNVDYDLNCGDVAAKRFRVVGYDKHGFDGDSDGIGCER